MEHVGSGPSSLGGFRRKELAFHGDLSIGRRVTGEVKLGDETEASSTSSRIEGHHSSLSVHVVYMR
jgi:hypothetical protein